MSAIVLPDSLDATQAVALQGQLQRSIAAHAGSTCVLDVSAVRRFDSAGLSLLLACRRHAQSLGKTLTVQGWSNSLLALARVYGVLELLDPAAAALSSAEQA